MSEYLLDKLNEYSASDFYPLHMPGHKRRVSHFGDPFRIDITEIDGFDDLHHAQGILLEAQRRAAQLYGAEETYYLVNGSTCGILAAIAAATTRGGGLLMARNSHMSCYHAVYLNDLCVTYLYPPIIEMGRAAANVYNALSEGTSAAGVRGVSGEGASAASVRRTEDCKICGSIRPEEVREALQRHSGIQAVLVTSPTYDGVVSDIRAIAEAAHEAGAVLIVDEAHGAHFGMHPYFPASALSCGADIVINSLHKTLPSLTQTALLHVQGGRADREKLRKYLDVYQTSSPSYVLMAGMDACVRLLTERGDELFDTFAERLERMRGELKRRLRVLRLLDREELAGQCGFGANSADPEQAGLNEIKKGMAAAMEYETVYDFDRSKVLISTERCAMSGPELAGILRGKYHLEPEMAAAGYVTAIMTIADEQEGFDRLTSALLEIDAELFEDKKQVCRDPCAGKNTSIDLKYNELRQGDSPNDNAAEERKSMENRTGYPYEEKVLHMRRAGYPRNEAVLSICQATDAAWEPVPLSESAGRVAAEYVYVYPPGIPLLVPGERISEELLRRFREEEAAGLKLRGMADPERKLIRVVKG